MKSKIRFDLYPMCISTIQNIFSNLLRFNKALFYKGYSLFVYKLCITIELLTLNSQGINILLTVYTHSYTLSYPHLGG